MLALNTRGVQRKIAICFERVRNPEITVASLAEMFDLSETQIYRDLAWGKDTGYFGEEAKRTAIELRVQHAHRAKQYYKQLELIWREKRRAMRELKLMREQPLPEPPELRLYHLKAMAALEEIAVAGYTREQERLEGLILALEKTQLEVSGIADAAAAATMPRSVRVVLVEANGSGSLGTS